MKYLSEYTEKAQTNLFEKTGTFFAFSGKQYNESRKVNVKYINMGIGMICPEKNVKQLIDGLYSIQKGGIKQDVKENGIEKIIIRELYNYESFYTMDWTNAVEQLEQYGITEKEVRKIYFQEKQNALENSI